MSVSMIFLAQRFGSLGSIKQDNMMKFRADHQSQAIMFIRCSNTFIIRAIYLLHTTNLFQRKVLNIFLSLYWFIYYFMIPCWGFKELYIKSLRFQYKGSSLLSEWWIYSRSDDGWIHTSSQLRQFWLSVAGLAELQLL